MKLFRPSNKVFIRNNKGTHDAYFNSRTLTQFFYIILEIPNCKEQMRVPSWIYTSPKSVKIAYLQQAFDMEGTILKKLCEIRFITKDRLFAYDLKRLLRQLSITSTVNPRIGGTHRTRQYRLSIYGKENFKKFRQINFRTPFLKDRFYKLVEKYKI